MMRSLINLVEGMFETKSDEPPALDDSTTKLLAAVRAWGDTTHGDYQGKVDALLALRDHCARFTRPTPWLYRGTGCTVEQHRDLQQGHEVEIDDRPMLSWTHDFGTAQDFAESSLLGEFLLLEKQGLTPFFDYTLFAEYLDEIGYDYSDDLALTDPIREEEVIVFTGGPLVVSANDINEAFL